jgi:hypothetical protein
MFRRFAFGALFAALVVTLAAPPAQAAQLAPSPGAGVLSMLASWLAHWWPWAAAKTPPIPVKCGGGTNPDGRCLTTPTPPPSIVQPFCGGGINPDGCH